jgi:hypothetical protein
MMSKFLSKTPITYGFVNGDSTVRIYFLQYLGQNLCPMTEEHQSHVPSCVVFAGLANLVIYNCTVMNISDK